MSNENEFIPTGWHLVTAVLSTLAAAFTGVVAFLGHRLLKDLDEKATNERVSSLEGTLAATRAEIALLRTERQSDANAIRQEIGTLRTDALSMHGSNTKLLTDIALKLAKLS